MALPVVTIEQMRVADTASPLTEQELIERAGHAIAEAAQTMLDEIDGSRICVLVGPGNNGADGRVAARLLETNGVDVTVISVEELSDALPGFDVVIDSAFGTGFRGTFTAPDVHEAVVLSVDIPSGLNGDTGVAQGSPFLADKTVTLGAIKTGLLFGEGPEYCGELVLNTIDIDVQDRIADLITIDDVLEWMPQRSRLANKWSAAACIVAGSPGMLGAADLCTEAAYRAGAGMVRLCQPGLIEPQTRVIEAVAKAITMYETQAVLNEAERCHAIAIGPGLGRNPNALSLVRDVLQNSPLPVVVDGDGLFALGERDAARELLAPRIAPTILTPHEGEYARLAGRPPGMSRIDEVSALAKELKSFVLLKGPTTIVAAPYGDVHLVSAGDERLATAGAGDVLTGIIVSLLAQGVPPFEATSAAAYIHGAAAANGLSRGFMAHDLLTLLPAWFDEHCP